METLIERAAHDLGAVKRNRPLIHNITNFVVMNFTANTLLAMGASPVMAHATEEVEAMTAIAGALVLNIGTLSTPWIESMLRAGAKAAELGKPVVLDPVGAGATDFRTTTARRILTDTRISVVRGNASEILALAEDTTARTKGVDGQNAVDEVAQVARDLAVRHRSVIAATGPEDLVTDGRRSVRVANGHPLLAGVTGTGCAASATIGAFLAVDPDPFAAAAGALAFFGLAGEWAGRRAEGPGSFLVALVDAIHNIAPRDLSAGCRFRQE